MAPESIIQLLALILGLSLCPSPLHAQDAQQPIPICTARADNTDIEILSDVGKAKTSRYMKKVLGRVQKHWHDGIPSIAQPPTSRSGVVAIRFSILRSGELTRIAYECSAGDSALDEAAWKAITKTRAPRLPKEFERDSVQVRFFFRYNQK